MDDTASTQNRLREKVWARLDAARIGRTGPVSGKI